MRHELVSLKNSEIEITVTIPFAEFEPHVKKAGAKVSEEVEIEGFRRGKAPYEKVKERVGEYKIYERAAEEAIRTTYPKILKEVLDELGKKNGRETVPLGRPEITITKLTLGNELEYKVRLAVLPEVKLPDYKAIAARVLKNKQSVQVSDAEVDKTVDWIRESRLQLVAVDRPAQKDDQIEVDFEVRHGGVKIEQGESRNHPIIIGKGKFIPGFEDRLVGMKAGDEKEFTLKAPDTWHEKSLAGKALDFKVMAKSVQERKLPELNDEFAQRLGNFLSVEDLKKSVREGISQEKEEKEKQRIQALVVDEIGTATTIEIPEVLKRSELQKMFAELKSGVEGMGMKWEDYLLHVKKTEKELVDEWGPEAERRVRAALVLREIANREKIDASKEEIEARANQFLRQFKSAEGAEKNIDPGELYEYTKGVLRNEKVFEFLEKMT